MSTNTQLRLMNDLLPLGLAAMRAGLSATPGRQRRVQLTAADRSGADRIQNHARHQSCYNKTDKAFQKQDVFSRQHVRLDSTSI